MISFCWGSKFSVVQSSGFRRVAPQASGFRDWAFQGRAPPGLEGFGGPVVMGFRVVWLDFKFAGYSRAPEH